MLLVIGGAASGKRTYVRSLGYDASRMSDDPLDDAPVLCGLHEALRQGPLSEATQAALLRKDVVICTEMGMGVVPLRASERAWRERVGRACCELAVQADGVVRMVCGIPVRVK